MLVLAQKIDDLLSLPRMLADKAGAPLLDLAARLYLGYAFFKSGTLRLADWWNGNFSNQIFLFELEHPVPGLDPTTAAYMAMGGEIILPILLVLGLFGRFAAAGLLIMTAIIDLTYIHSADHIIWGILGLTIFIKGPGLLSLDSLILKLIRKEYEPQMQA